MWEWAKEEEKVRTGSHVGKEWCSGKRNAKLVWIQGGEKERGSKTNNEKDM